MPAAAWALGAGFVAVAVPVLVLWAADSRSAAGAGAALRSVAQVWLLAHGAALRLGAGSGAAGGTLGLLPLGLTALPLLLLERAARHAATEHHVHTVPEGARLAAGVAGPYALVLAVVAVLAGTKAVHPDVVEALVGASLLGLAGAGTGVVRGAGLWRELVGSLPRLLVRVGPPAGAAVLALVAAGALAAGGSLAVHAGRAADLAAATSPGVFGSLGLLLLGLAYVPVAALWGVGYLAGPGIAVGVGTSVGPFGVTAGAVPSFPLLAALPGSATTALGWLLLTVPVATGVLSAVLAERRGVGPVEALLAGPLAGAVLALLAWLASGELGGGRLTQVGPSWWQVGAAVTAEVTAGAAGWWLYRRVRPVAAA